ncbi:MAG TPA: hypothetical protein VGJ25_07510 [Gaiellaceae bacterium]
MPIIGTCTAPGCKTVTIGARCVAHDEKIEIEFVRGRPFGRMPLKVPRLKPAQLKVTSGPA